MPLTLLAGAPESAEQAPDVQVVTRVSGPEPGYLACSVFIVQASAAPAPVPCLRWPCCAPAALAVLVAASTAADAAPAPQFHPAQAAISVLEERSRLPAPGVHTPVSLLRKTGYVGRLQRHGIKFEQLDSPAVQ